MYHFHAIETDRLWLEHTQKDLYIGFRGTGKIEHYWVDMTGTHMLSKLFTAVLSADPVQWLMYDL